MHQRVKIITVLFAWFLATGTPWDLVQTFGWGRMIAQYAQSMPLSEAVKRTFSGEMCGVCEVVNDARQADDPALPRLGGGFDPKLLALAIPPTLVFAAPAAEPWPRATELAPSLARAAPPVPPPRA